MQVQGQVGPQVVADGAAASLRQDRQGSQVITDAHGRYHEASSRGRVFTAANQAGKALTPFATSSTTGFVLLNPTGSGVVLSILEIMFLQTSTAAATASAFVALSASAPAATAFTGQSGALTVRNNSIGSANAGSGLAYDTVTSKGTTDVLIRPIWQPSVSATATTSIPPFIRDEVAGLICVQPGSWVAMSASSALSGITSMTWEEVPA